MNGLITQTLNMNDKVGDIATQIPGATSVFRKYKIDFCCGGNIPLSEVCGENFASLQEELTALIKFPNGETQWETISSKKIINHLLENFHSKHRHDLPELLLMAKKVEAVHGDKKSCPVGLASLVAKMTQELEIHMQKEEQILFPSILNEYPGQHLLTPVEVMRADHEAVGKDIEKLEKLTNNFTPPQDACNTWRALFLGLKTFVDELMNHVHIENNILFPRVVGE